MKTFDYCILGAGVTGIHLALELIKTGATICVVDPNGAGGGASGAPIGLANPATGRFATKSWEVDKCLPKLQQNLELIQEHTSKPFFRKSGILRPAMDVEIATKMKVNAEQDGWPEGWIEWLDEKAVEELHPGITCVEGGVWIPVGLTVNMKSYVESACELLQAKGVDFYFDQEYSISDNSPWTITFPNSKIAAGSVIFTSGIWTKYASFWGDIPMVPVKGQTLLMQSDTPLPFQHSVSALGYIGSVAGNTYVIGSTYEHRFEDEETDEAGKEYLLERSNRVIPSLWEQSKIVDQWASVRASTPNRKPIMGAHPKKENCYVFAGLGSKGLLYSAYLAEWMTGYLTNNVELPEEMKVERFKKFRK